MWNQQRYEDAVGLLKELIATPSFSREEDNTAAILVRFLEEYGVLPIRHLNNVWALNKHFDPRKPNILLNSHHDTVKPNPQYTRDPFAPVVEDGKLFGLGSNDAGGCLVSLIAAFLHFYDMEGLPYNILLAASAEEEISGVNGIESILEQLPPIDFAIVGEPTKTDLAVAEKRIDGARLRGAWQSRPCRARRRRECVVQSDGRHQLVPQFPFPESIAHAGAGKNERDRYSNFQ